MHSFATIQEFVRFEIVTFYTLKGEDATLSEMNDFLERMEKELTHVDQLEQLLLWLEIIGNHQKGAVLEQFRQERICVALPPRRKYLDNKIDLRLYCHYVSKSVVILYNGGIKTTNNAQYCPNVSRHFYNAQIWTKRLNEIGIVTNGREIINIEELYIKY